MNKLIKTKGMIIVIALLVTLGIICAYVYDPFAMTYIRWPSDFSNYSDTGLFRINTGTILASLGKGNVDVFQPDLRSLDDVDWTGPVLYKGPIRWRQSDYLEIAGALNQFVWNDTLDDWSLFRMSFSTACQENPNGLTGGDFAFFKTNFEKGKITYSWRTMLVAPDYLDVAWEEVRISLTPYLDGEVSI